MGMLLPCLAVRDLCRARLTRGFDGDRRFLVGLLGGRFVGCLFLGVGHE